MTPWRGEGGGEWRNEVSAKRRRGCFLKISREPSRTRVVSRRVSRIDMSSRNLFTLPVHGETLYLPREFRFAPWEKKKKLDSSNGTRGDGTSRWISFYLERRFATFCQKKLKDRMEEQLRFCEKKKEKRNQIHVTKISRMDRSNHFVNRFIKQNEISFICTIMSNYQRYTFNIYIYISWMKYLFIIVATRYNWLVESQSLHSILPFTLFRLWE